MYHQTAVKWIIFLNFIFFKCNSKLKSMYMFQENDLKKKILKGCQKCLEIFP